MKDRIVQMAAKLVLEPIFEADFLPSSFGFRPRIGTLQALETIREEVNSGRRHVLDADIRDYFGSIDQMLLMERVSRRVSGRRVLKLLRGWLQAGVMEEGTYSETVSGTPQGGVISPLLSNIYLHFLDSVWQRQCAEVGTLVRYADDFVVLCRSHEAVEEAERRVRLIFERLKLTLHPEKTRHRKFRQLDEYVVRRLNMFRWRRHRRHAKPGQRLFWEREAYEALGLHRLRGTIRYPKQCMLHRESSPVSRVREIRTHGLKGGGGVRTA